MGYPLMISAPAAGFAFFFAYLFVIISPVGARLFLGRYGRRHRIFGAAFLLWLVFGFVDLFILRGMLPRLAYNVILSLLGIGLTLSAAFDFREHHARVKNAASGPLDEHATVTYDEMLEHSFYHLLNLAQIVFLHVATDSRSSALDQPDLTRRLWLVLLTTSPWLFRSLFPVHSFSANYNSSKTGKKPFELVAILYRLKKYQYVFYKHFLLHGLNVTVAFRGGPSAEDLARGEQPLTSQLSFQLYWLALNTAYVMEFFLQTLVKRKFMRQRTMLCLNQLLMLVATLVALQVLQHVDLRVAIFSFGLNLTHRSRPFGEMINFLAVVAVGAVLLRLDPVG